MKRILLGLSILLLFTTVLLVSFVGAVYVGFFGALPSSEDLKSIKNETATLVYSSDDRLIGKYFAQNRTNTAFEALPQHLINALVATEDARFFDHSGVDYQSLGRVVVKSILLGDRSSGGGSTISQQLAKNLYGRQYRGPLALAVNKVKEFIVAGRLEEHHTKNDLIRLYFNTVPFGENVYGVETAAQRYFNKSVSNLKIEEAAVLVGMLKANTKYNPRLNPENALHRRNVVLTQMNKYGFISGHEADSLSSEAIKLNYKNLSHDGPAEYFLVQVRAEAEKIISEIDNSIDIETEGLRITTTLDYRMQSAALMAFERHLSQMQTQLNRLYTIKRKRNAAMRIATQRLSENGLDPNDTSKKRRLLFSWEGALVDSVSALDSALHSELLLHAGLTALDPLSGAVRAWVGGIDHDMFPYDQVLAQRQVASAFKPILYTAALEAGITPCTYLSNKPVEFEDYDNWTPQNYDMSEGGYYSLSGALQKSINIASVDLLTRFDRTILENLWSDLKFSQKLPAGPSVALGTVSSSLLELALAYGAISNGGKYVAPYFVNSITTEDGRVLYEREQQDGRQVIAKENAQLMQEMMRRVVQNGTGAAIHFAHGIRHDIAGKTGTSQDYADAWFGAFTSNLVIATRVGASSPKIHFDGGSYGSGSKLALPLVGYVLKSLQDEPELEKKYFAAFRPLPAHLIQSLDCPDYRENPLFDNIFDLFRKRHNVKQRGEKREGNEENNNNRNRNNKKDEESDGILQRLFKKLRKK